MRQSRTPPTQVFGPARTPPRQLPRVLTSQHIRSELLLLSLVRLKTLTASRWVSKNSLSALATVQQLQPKEFSDEPVANEPYTNTTSTCQPEWCWGFLEQDRDIYRVNWGWMHFLRRVSGMSIMDRRTLYARNIRSTDHTRSLPTFCGTKLCAFGLQLLGLPDCCDHRIHERNTDLHQLASRNTRSSAATSPARPTLPPRSTACVFLRPTTLSPSRGSGTSSASSARSRRRTARSSP